MLFNSEIILPCPRASVKRTNLLLFSNFLALPYHPFYNDRIVRQGQKELLNERYVVYIYSSLLLCRAGHIIKYYDDLCHGSEVCQAR